MTHRVVLSPFSLVYSCVLAATSDTASTKNQRHWFMVGWHWQKFCL